MGNNIYADGEFKFDKPLSDEKVKEINEYLGAEHREEGAINPWCDYRVNNNEIEVSEGYNDSLDAEWLKEILKRLPEGTVVKGEVNYKDDYGEYWIYKIAGNKLFRQVGYIAYEEEEEV